MRGIYSFVLVFVFIACLLFLIHGAGIVRGKLAEGSGIAMEIERTSFIRFMLEENTDAVIEETIEMEVKLGNREPGALNRKIAENLLAYFRGMEGEQQGAKVEFFEVNIVSLSKHFTPTGKLGELKGIEEYCSTSVTSTGKNVFLVDFRFTGGLMKNTAVLGRISSGKAEQYFLLLPGYSAERVVVAA